MLLGRYFLYAGAVLLALLLVADWYLPSPPPPAGFGEPIDSAMVRIKSQHKWPQRLQFDTSAPSLLPPSSPPVVAATAPAESVPAPDPKLNAMAEATPSEKQAAAKPKPRVATRHRYRPPAQPRQFAVNPWPSAWAQNW